MGLPPPDIRPPLCIWSVSFELSDILPHHVSKELLSCIDISERLYCSSSVSAPIHILPTLVRYCFVWKHQKLPLLYFFFCPSYCPPGFILLSRCFTSLPHSALRFFSVGQSALPAYHFYFHGLDRHTNHYCTNVLTDDHYYTNVMIPKMGHHQFKQLFTFLVHPFHVLRSSARREETPGLPCLSASYSGLLTSWTVWLLLGKTVIPSSEIRHLGVSFFMS